VNYLESLTLDDAVLAYQSKIKEVAAKFSKSVPYSAKVVSSHPCERRASYLLENYPSEETRFDPYYGLKHDHATRKLVDALKNSIHSMGISDVHVITEYRTDMGFNDVVIVAGSPVRLFAEGSEIARIELKASEGFDFEQLDRYILDRVPVIFARVPTGQVAYFDPEKLRDYTSFSAGQQLPKIDRLLRDEPIIVSGRWCQDCPDLSCPHNRNHMSNAKRYVQVPRAAFAEDICSHLENLPGVIEEIVALVKETLGRKLQNKTG
jgi:hypothetical protein